MHEGSTVTVTSSIGEDKVLITVSDNGTDMTIEEQEKLFTPQIDILSNSEDNKSDGIGLLLVKDFMEKNGGTIWVKSSKGEGSSFHFTLPAAKS